MTAGKIRLLLLACVGAMLAWGVAPALSRRPYAPQPTDFTQPVPETIATGAPDSARGSREPDGPVRFHYPGPSVAADFGPAQDRGAA